MFPWFTFPAWDASLSWKSTSVNLTEKEEEMKKGKQKRKQGGRKGKEVGNDRNQQRRGDG